MKRIQWNFVERQSLAQEITYFYKTNNINHYNLRQKEYETIARCFLLPYIAHRNLPSSFIDDKLKAVIQQIKWALSPQTDTSLIKNHPHGLKFKTRYQELMRVMGLDFDKLKKLKRGK